jgi:hypothetical protein
MFLCWTGKDEKAQSGQSSSTDEVRGGGGEIPVETKFSTPAGTHPPSNEMGTWALSWG